MRGYIPLPAFKTPGPLDFSPINEGLDALGKSMERNRLLEEQKEIGKALQSGSGGGSQSQPSSSASAGNNRLLTSSSPAQYGTSSVVDRIIGVESGGNPNAKNPRSSATGPGQFIDSTWLSTIKSSRPDLAAGKTDAQLLAMRSDPNLSREMTGAYASQNAGTLSRGGFEATPGNTYLAHFAGPGGATAVLKADPNTPVRQVLGDRVVQANPFLANMTAGDLRNWADRKMGGSTAATPQPRAAAPGLNYGAGVNAALGQGNLDVAMRLQDAQRSDQDTAYNRGRQERQDALTNESTQLSIQATREKLAEAAQQRVAGVAQTIAAETDPARKAAMWQKFVAAGGGKIAQTLQQYGIDPNDVEAGSRLIIAEARGLTETKPSEFGTFKSDEGIYRKGPAGVEVLREATPKPQQLDANSRKEIFEADEAIRAGSNVIGSLDRALQLNGQAYSGPGAQTGGYVTSLFGNERGAATEELQNVVTSQVLENLKATFGASPTEGERQILLDVQGSVNKSPEVRKRIFEAARGAAERRIAFNSEKAQALRGGEYFKPGYSPIQPTAPAASGGPQNAPVRVNSPEEAMQLPSGTQFVTPDGRIKVRP